jgi:hypothetical protein
VGEILRNVLITIALFVILFILAAQPLEAQERPQTVDADWLYMQFNENADYVGEVHYAPVPIIYGPKIIMEYPTGEMVMIEYNDQVVHYTFKVRAGSAPGVYEDLLAKLKEDPMGLAKSFYCNDACVISARYFAKAER